MESRRLSEWDKKVPNMFDPTMSAADTAAHIRARVREHLSKSYQVIDVPTRGQPRNAILRNPASGLVINVRTTLRDSVAFSRDRDNLSWRTIDEVSLIACAMLRETMEGETVIRIVTFHPHDLRSRLDAMWESELSREEGSPWERNPQLPFPVYMDPLNHTDEQYPWRADLARSARDDELIPFEGTQVPEPEDPDIDPILHAMLDLKVMIAEKHHVSIDDVTVKFEVAA